MRIKIAIHFPTSFKIWSSWGVGVRFSKLTYVRVFLFFIQKVTYFKHTSNHRPFWTSEVTLHVFPRQLGHSKGGHFWRFLGCVYKTWPSWGGGQNSIFGVCMAHLFLAQLKKRGGGHFYMNWSFFKECWKCASTFFFDEWRSLQEHFFVGHVQHF